MNKILMLIVSLIFLLPLAFATQIIQVNSTTPLVYQLSFNGTLQNLTTVSASINNITGNVLVSYAPAEKMTGVPNTYYYNFTPVTIGSYLVTFNTTFLGEPFEQSSDILVVNNINAIAQDTSNIMAIPLLIGFSVMLLIFFFAYLGYRIQNVKDAKPDDLWKEPRFYLGFQFYLFSILFIILLFFLIMQMTVGLSYYPIIQTLFYVIASVFGSVMLLFAFMTIPLLCSSVYKILTVKKQ